MIDFDYHHEWGVVSFHFLLYGFDFVCEQGDLCAQIHSPDVHHLALLSRLLPHCIYPGSFLCSQDLVKFLNLLFDGLLSPLSLELSRNTFLLKSNNTTSFCGFCDFDLPWCDWPFYHTWVFLLSITPVCFLNASLQLWDWSANKRYKYDQTCDHFCLLF